MVNHSVMMAVLALLVSAAAGCKKECTALRGGGCFGSSEHCGAVLQCGSDKLDLRCDVAQDKGLSGQAPVKGPLTCHCIENGVDKKTVTLADPVPNDLVTAAKMAKSACGW